MSELYYAEMEAARNEAEDAYFNARPQLMRTLAEQSIFRAGFERAFQKLWQQSPPNVWQPIETAPKDGRRFLAIGLGPVFFAHWGSGANVWQDDTGAYREPRYWKPMPEGPCLDAVTKVERCQQCEKPLPPLAQWSMPSCPECVDKADRQAAETSAAHTEFRYTPLGVPPSQALQYDRSPHSDDDLCYRVTVDLVSVGDRK